MGNPFPKGIVQQVEIGKIVERVEQFARRTPLWDLLEGEVWHVWREQNTRWHSRESMSANKLVERIIKELHYTFNEGKIKAFH